MKVIFILQGFAFLQGITEVAGLTTSVSTRWKSDELGYFRCSCTAKDKSLDNSVGGFFNLFKDEKLMQAAGECTNSKETYKEIFCSQYQERENRCEGWQSGYTKNDNCAITCEGSCRMCPHESCGSDLSLGKIIVIGIICLFILFLFMRCCCTKKVPPSNQTATQYVRSNPTRSFWSR